MLMYRNVLEFLHLIVIILHCLQCIYYQHFSARPCKSLLLASLQSCQLVSQYCTVLDIVNGSQDHLIIDTHITSSLKQNSMSWANVNKRCLVSWTLRMSLCWRTIWPCRYKAGEKNHAYRFDAVIQAVEKEYLNYKVQYDGLLLLHVFYKLDVVIKSINGTRIYKVDDPTSSINIGQAPSES